MTFENILVVCVGNICRSPIAEALLRSRYPDKQIDSAGVGALVGHAADPNAVAVMAAMEIDITGHVAKQINAALVGQADLILTMSVGQTKWIEAQWPHCRGKIFRIGHWLDQDIADPYRRDRSAFEITKQDIIASLELWADKIS
jgi:protein-tyrosine phosphatase